MGVQLGLVDVDEEEDNETKKTHTEEEDERHVGVTSSSSGDSGGYEGADEAGCLADSVEERKEEVGLRSGNELGEESDLIRRPSSHLEIPSLGKPELPFWVSGLYSSKG